MNSLNFLFAWRYFKARKSTNAITIIAWISVGAIIIGTTALILVLSVFNGFEGLVKSLYSSFYTDLKIFPVSGKVIKLTREQIEKLKGIEGIRNYSLVAESKAFLKNGDDQAVVFLKGVDEHYRYVAGVADNLVNGTYELGTEDSPKLVLGAGIEDALNIQADRNIYTLKIHLPRRTGTEQLDELSGITNDTIQSAAAFRIQQDFDNKYGITNLAFVKKSLLLGENEFTGVEIAVKDPDETNRVKKDIKKMLGETYMVQDRYEQNRSLYAIMNVERWVIYGILCLILVVAAFNMIGALTMLVLEKQKDISVLHALGGSKGFIRRTFLSEGILLALIGASIGMLLALLIAWLQIKFHLIPLTGGSFLISYFPVKLRPMDFVLVGATVFVIAVIASWVPAAKAANQEFSLRSE